MCSPLHGDPFGSNAVVRQAVWPASSATNPAPPYPSLMDSQSRHFVSSVSSLDQSSLAGAASRFGMGWTLRRSYVACSWPRYAEVNAPDSSIEPHMATLYLSKAYLDAASPSPVFSALRLFL